MRKVLSVFLVSVIGCVLAFAEIDDLFQKAKVMQREKQYSEAVKTYQKYLTKYPEAKKSSDAQYNI